MALADVIHRVYSILYGSGLGEKPAIRLAASDASESTSGQTITFSLASGEGNKCKPGQVLSVYDPDTEADAHAFLITSISTDAITAVNGWDGTPEAGDGDLDSAVFEQNPLVPGFKMFEAVDTIIANYLWPQVYGITKATIASPDLTYGQEAVAAAALEIINAHQLYGSEVVPVASTHFPQDVNSSLASTEKLASFDWINGTTGYYTYKHKLAESDLTDDHLRMVATGAAALCLDASIAATTLNATKKDNTEAVSRRSSAGSTLWRDFLTMKQGLSEQLGRTGDANRILIDRG